MRESREAHIAIDGVQLSHGEAATLRCAVANWLHELAEPAYREQLGPIAESYRRHLSRIQELIFESIERRR